jgi:phosphatidate cytidylyltransferase
MMAMLAISIREWALMSNFSKVAQWTIAGLIFITGVHVVFYQPLLLTNVILMAMPISVLFWLIVVPVLLWSQIHIKNSWLMGLTGLVALVPFGLAMIGLRDFNPFILLGIAMIVWIADSAAYFIGKRYGKHKLAPLVSPGKTWEGVVGAWLATSIYALIMIKITELSYWFILLFWALMAMSILGDLFESLIKRQAGVKDSGNLLPGHGGLLDRVDGLMPVVPFVVFIMMLPIYIRYILTNV